MFKHALELSALEPSPAIIIISFSSTYFKVEHIDDTFFNLPYLYKNVEVFFSILLMTSILEQ